MIKDFKNENIVVLARYKPQINRLRKTFGSKIKILNMSYDGTILLQSADVFIGSGGTMTAESALLGIPTISYNAVPNIIENYLVRKKIVKRETNPKKVSRAVSRYLNSSNVETRKRAKKLVLEMEDPYKKLVTVMKSV